MKLILTLPDAVGRPFIEDDRLLFGVEFGLKHACDYDSRLLPRPRAINYRWKIIDWNDRQKKVTLEQEKY
jgi:hypothetical protein